MKTSSKWRVGIYLDLLFMQLTIIEHLLSAKPSKYFFTLSKEMYDECDML